MKENKSKATKKITREMKKSVIEAKVGIYDSEYVIKDYGEYIIVLAPYVRWRDNTGSLAHRKVRVEKENEKEAVRKFAEEDELILPANNNAGHLSLPDVLDGNMAVGVRLLDEWPTH